MTRNCVEQWLSDITSLWNFHIVFDDLDDIDAIVCLGSYDLRVADRCADLLLDGLAPIAVITGHLGNWTRHSFDKPEAEIFAEVILKRGVASDKLLIERNATNIGQNVEFSKKLLLPYQVRRVAFLTKPQTQKRVAATVPVKWPEIDAKISAPLHDLLEQARDQQGILKLTDELVGDLQRMLEYPTLGFQSEVDIPPPVLDAYRRLRALGFDKHCVHAR
jgi:uncharacterized SAM-binding protein YcdF (DUF218 family)